MNSMPRSQKARRSKSLVRPRRQLHLQEFERNDSTRRPTGTYDCTRMIKADKDPNARDTTANVKGYLGCCEPEAGASPANWHTAASRNTNTYSALVPRTSSPIWRGQQTMDTVSTQLTNVAVECLVYGGGGGDRTCSGGRGHAIYPVYFYQHQNKHMCMYS